MPRFLEKHTAYCGIFIDYVEKLYSHQSEFQLVEVFETKDFGRLLALDSCIMLTERDEFIYHEMIVHSVMAIHPEPRRVLIIGGGDGGSLREVLRYKSITDADLVEIDPAVIAVAKDFFPTLSQSFNEQRANVIVKDGFDHLGEFNNYYDIIIVDSLDPVGESAKLFSLEFYKLAQQALKPDGLFICQSDTPFHSPQIAGSVKKKLSQLYAHVTQLIAYIPTYPSGLWSFTCAGQSINPSVAVPVNLSFQNQLRYYSAQVFNAAQAIPSFIKT